MSGCSLNEKEEVRAATCSPSISASELRSSSVSPSEKYCCSLSPLKFTNGSTATECGGGAKAAADGVKCLEIQKYAGAAKTTTAMATIATSGGFDRRDARTGSLIAAVAPDPALIGDSSGDSRRFIRSTKLGGVSPAGRRVHCTCRKRSGTSARASLVSSMTTGTRNARRSDMSPERSTANLQSRRK